MVDCAKDTGCKALSDGEFEDTMKAFGGSYATRNRALFVAGITTGYRISELLSLRVGDVRQLGKILEHVTVARENMKDKFASRTTRLLPAARAAIRTWLDELEAAGQDVGPHSFLFRGQRGPERPICTGQAWRILKVVFAAAGVAGRTGTNSMRKTFAEGIYALFGRDLVKTAKSLGHRNLDSTACYISFHIDQEEIDEAILSLYVNPK